MEPLIIEIRTRGLYRYHRLVDSELTIGRALDNDIILSDPTVEPHHLKVQRNDDGSVALQNLAETNPSRFDDQVLDHWSADELPKIIHIGRITARILPLDYRVATTKPLAGNGNSSRLLGNPVAGLLLVTLCVLVGGLEYFFTSHNALKWDEMIKFVLRETILSIAAFVLVLAVFERLLVNRWEIKLVTISVALIYLIYQLLSMIANELMYLFSSDLIPSVFNLAWYLLFIPVAVSFYLIRVSHLGQRKGVILAIMISSPFAALAIMQNPAINSMFDDFSPTAKYQKSLSPLNLHFSRTVSISEFIEQSATLEPGEFSD